MVSMTGCACEHNYVETKVDATCTSMGYSVFTCSECNDTYNGEPTIPLKNHTGINKCTVCNTNLIPIWKDFIGSEGGTIVFEGSIAGTLSYSNEFDCILYAISDLGTSKTWNLILCYNAYDQEWTWILQFYFTGWESNALEIFGTFSQWSSRSSTLKYASDQDVSLSTFIDPYKKLYNAFINTANSKLKELGYNITMANFGLEN